MRRQQKALYIRKIVSQLPRSVAAMEITEIYRTNAHMIKNVDPEAKIGGAGVANGYKPNSEYIDRPPIALSTATKCTN